MYKCINTCVYICIYLYIYIKLHCIFPAPIQNKTIQNETDQKTQRQKGKVVLTDLINKTYAWQKFRTHVPFHFRKCQVCNMYGILVCFQPGWFHSFYLWMFISIGCSVSSTLLCQIILCCCCCIPLKCCHISTHRQLPICSGAGWNALTAQRRIQPAVMPAGLKDVI